MKGYRSEDSIYEFPPTRPETLGRVISAARTGDVVWAATQHEHARANRVLLVRRENDHRDELRIDTEGYAHLPALAAHPDGAAVDVAWNEAIEDGWAIRALSVSRDGKRRDSVATVSAAAGPFLPPALVRGADGPWAVWSGRHGDRFRIFLSACRNTTWTPPAPVSSERCDAFRPALAAAGDGVVAVWDRYRDGTYEIVLAHADRAGHEILWTGRRDGERWFCPRIAAAADGTVYIAWAVLREVEDPQLGIVDHFPFAMAARLRNGQVELLPDAGNAQDPRIVADFREGLLGEVTYKGYNGLRRRPQLAVGSDNLPWCVWEVRMEHYGERKCIGRLAGRKLNADGTWGPAAFLHRDAYAYGVAPTICGGEIAVGHIRPEITLPPHLEAARLPLAGAEPFTVEPARWKRWRPVELSVPRKPTDPVSVGDRTYRLFWADTHCHSNVSPDAEGEPDELIHFARDAAGLDAVCVVDNDYYPHKALTEAEWRIHQAFAAHFTGNGRFVVFPGYEYTYHRKDLHPNFNHRYVMYPRAGGRLLRRIDPGSETDAGLLASDTGIPALCIPHHCTWQLLDPAQEPNVEICSSWRVCMEETDFALSRLKQGDRFGFIGSSDSHRALPGLGGALTGIYATELTPEALFEAYRHRRLVATQGFFAEIDFRVAGTFIGGETASDGSPVVCARVRAPDRIESVRILRDGKTVHEIRPGKTETDLEFRDNAAAGTHFYFLRLKLEGDPSFNVEGDPAANPKNAFSLESRYPHNMARARGVLAWTSPVWVTVH